MTETTRVTRETWRGLDCTRLTLTNGDSALVSDFGAQVLSWQVNGQERLFVSPLAVTDGSAAIRGGIPVCFPQFNQRGPLPKHGLARTALWTYEPAATVLAADHATLQWALTDSDATRAQWPHAFAATLQVQLQPGQLGVELTACNTDSRPWTFTAALHTYLQTEQVQGCALAGLEHMPFWDAAQGFAPAVQLGSVGFGGEVDRVYPRANVPLRLHGQLPSALQIAQDAVWNEVVVWNPGPALCAQLGDMEAHSWQHMLCVEAAQINQPVALQPGACWQGAQLLTVLPT